ncbi:LysR family transcriptional regulator [Rhizobium sp. 2YAF20]|uniref:LysR family transcriptional regulator n=1 Tax=Rhizobium sp. 2YAF20 TaxID=3233027 RepID=UPI003F99F5CC
MNSKPALSDLAAFVAIVSHRSFRKAADELGMSPSTLSHVLRTLEINMGVRLLNRTTRSVSPTEAGERLAARLVPVIRDFDLALEEVDEFRGRPSGTLRINTSEIAARVLLTSIVPAFLKCYPEMSLDLVTEGRLVDIVAEGFDAGIRLGESLPQDMIAVPFDGATRFVTVASPEYLRGRETPKTPDDLKDHVCIRFRMSSGKLFRWEFEKRGQEMAVDVTGPLTLDHMSLMTEAAVNGMGIAYISERLLRPYLESGALVLVLEDWCPWIPGLFLYYPGRRHVPLGLRAFIDVLKKAGGAGAKAAG